MVAKALGSHDDRAKTWMSRLLTTTLRVTRGACIALTFTGQLTAADVFSEKKTLRVMVSSSCGTGASNDRTIWQRVSV